MDLNSFEGMLRINKHRLDEELELQAEIQWRISEEMNSAGAKVAELKDRLGQVEAEAAKALLEQFPGLGDAKIKDQVRASPMRIRASAAYNSAKTIHERWISMHSAWVSRGFSLKSLCDLHHSDYFAVSSHTVADSDKVTSMRETMNQARKAVHSEEPEGKVRRRTLKEA